MDMGKMGVNETKDDKKKNNIEIKQHNYGI